MDHQTERLLTRNDWESKIQVRAQELIRELRREVTRLLEERDFLINQSDPDHSRALLNYGAIRQPATGLGDPKVTWVPQNPTKLRGENHIDVRAVDAKENYPWLQQYPVVLVVRAHPGPLAFIPSAHNSGYLVVIDR